MPFSQKLCTLIATIRMKWIKQAISVEPQMSWYNFIYILEIFPLYKLIWNALNLYLSGWSNTTSYPATNQHYHWHVCMDAACNKTNKQLQETEKMLLSCLYWMCLYFSFAIFTVKYPSSVKMFHIFERREAYLSFFKHFATLLFSFFLPLMALFIHNEIRIVYEDK